MAQPGGSSSSSGGPATTTETAAETAAAHHLTEALSVPSSRTTNVVVLDTTYQDETQRPKEKPLNAAEDLWLSTVDGRYSSSPIPVRVGPLHGIETFYVHKEILVQADWFRKALCGGFKEADEQAIDLPEEDPAIFHFLVAFLYEGRFAPIRPAAAALEPPVNKGKEVAVEAEEQAESSGSETASSWSDRSSNSSRQRRRRRRLRIRNRSQSQDLSNEATTPFEKRPGLHRPTCHCPQCLTRQDARCWQCGALRLNRPWGGQPPPPPQAGTMWPPPPLPVPARNGLPPNGAAATAAVVAEPPGHAINMPTARIAGEDMRTWLIAYELNLDVYVCANRFLMDGFRNAVMRSCIDMLETAGTDAAHPKVLHLCRKLYAGVPETDTLLKMVLARVGFLQPLLWRNAPEETSEFLVSNPEIAALMLRETVMRQEATLPRPYLPSMEGAWAPPLPLPREMMPY